MKVHPLPKKRNITIQQQSSTPHGNKKLRRLPHIFSRVLELPFRSDAEVEVEETLDCFRFTVQADDIDVVRTHTIEIHPGVTKIVVRTNGGLDVSDELELELEFDMWRFRLPETVRAELASAVFADGELIVTVPKGNEEDGDVWGDGLRGNNANNNNRLVLVQ
ncbi:hypothetical protein ACFE04_006029 [Oxalis oulophora]